MNALFIYIIHLCFKIKYTKYCKKNHIDWFVSCWDVESQKKMRKFKTKFNKVASAMIVHEKLLHTIAAEKKHTFISTGMSTMEDIEKAVKIFEEHDCPFELQHSNSSYPMDPSEANLKVIQKILITTKIHLSKSSNLGSVTLMVQQMIPVKVLVVL